MRYFSTLDGGRKAPATLAEAILLGAAPDGGLYMPETMPGLPSALAAQGSGNLAETARLGLGEFFADDVLADSLPEIARTAFSFPIPVTRLDAQLHVMELFHGPSASFKDVGARFLAECMQRLAPASERRTVLVATSGDTGAAVAAAFYRRIGFDVIILFPHGRVSPLQAHSLSCWGDNVRSFAVAGSFDDCQRLTRQAFANRDLSAKLGLTSANSINIGRLLPQIVYYLHAANLLAEEPGGRPGFIVPSGNLGNATACAMARLMGARIGPVLLACNANRTIAEFFDTGEWRPRASITTLATAMDVGSPSNMERLRNMFVNDQRLRGSLSAVAVNDAQICASIEFAYASWGRAWCPHTATGLYAFANLSDEVQQERPWVVAATAHPAKFGEVLEPLVGANTEMPSSLAELLERPARSERLPPDFKTFEAAITD